MFMIKSIFCFLFVGIAAFGDTVSVSPDKLAFGDQVLTTRAYQMVVLSNPTKKLLNIFGITADGDFSIPFTTCGGTLQTGACEIYIFFTPTTPGLRTGTLTINDDFPDSPPKVKLSGNGIPVSLDSITVSPNNTSIPLGLNQQV